MTKKKTSLCGALRAFKQKLLFRAGVSKKQVSRENLETVQPSIQTVFGRALCVEGATEDEAQAFVTELCTLKFSPAPGIDPDVSRNLLTQDAIDLVANCVWTQSWKTDVKKEVRVPQNGAAAGPSHTTAPVPELPGANGTPQQSAANSAEDTMDVPVMDGDVAAAAGADIQHTAEASHARKKKKKRDSTKIKTEPAADTNTAADTTAAHI